MNKKGQTNVPTRGRSKLEITKKKVFFSYNSDDEDVFSVSPEPKKKTTKTTSFITSVYISPLREYAPGGNSKENGEKSFSSTSSFSSKGGGTKKITPLSSKEKTEKEVIHVSSNINILEIDKRIRKILAERKREIPSLELRLSQLRWIKENTEDANEKLDARNGIWVINNKIREIQANTHLILYEKKVNPILEEYKAIVVQNISNPFVISPSVSRKETRKNNEVLRKKRNILHSFINVAQNYIAIKISEVIEKETLTCENCGSTDIDTSGDENYICNGCLACIEIMDNTPSFKDSDHINLSGRYTYTRPGHFVEIIKCFEGEQNIQIEDEIYRLIEKERTRHKITLEKLTKRQVYTFLKQDGRTAHYKNLNLIYSKVTGKKPPNISAYKKDLMTDLLKYEEAFEEIKGERVNSMKVLYKLLKLLERKGYECSEDDFYILEMDKLREHDEMHHKICKKLNWEYKPTI